MDCSVVIPVRNEAENIPLITAKIQNVLSTSDFEIIFVDDGSTDNSIEVLGVLAEKYNFVRYFRRKNENKITVGKALRLGIEHAKGKHIIIMDGDLSHDPKYIPYLLNCLETFDVVVASRFIPGGGMLVPFTLKKKICYSVFTLLVRTLSGIRVADFSHGFKAFRREILNSLSVESEGFHAYTEISIKAHVLGYKVGEYPILYGVRNKGVSKFKLSKSLFGYIQLLLWVIRKKWKSAA